METIKNIQKISIWFFAVVGAVYIITGLMSADGYFGDSPLVIHRTTQIPFIVCALAYGGSSFILSLANPEKDNKILMAVTGAICAIILTTIIALEVLFPDLIQTQ